VAKRIYFKAKERLALLTDLATMLTAGIPILEAVDSLLTDAKGNTKVVLEYIRKSVSNGDPLSVALERMPQAFDPVTINLIRAAEEGGTLDQTFRDLVVSIGKDIAFTDQIRAGLVYPLFVMVIFGGIVILMLTFVLPRIAKVFSNLHVHMPLVTRVMIRASNFFLADWPFVIVGVIALAILVGVIYHTQKRALIRGLLGMPGLAKLGDRIDFSRFTRSLGLLLHAGIPLNEALILSERVVQKKQVEAIVQRMRANVGAGKPLSDGLRGIKSTMPPMMIRSIETAEQSGTLEKTMQDLAEYFATQVSANLKTITALLEPILLVVVGIMVGTLMITIIAPMYNLISQINPGH
jgi:type IV pilus assembly protein PilC